jgi:WD40 repeat protein
MFPFDRVLIDPSAAELEQTLAAAANAANKGLWSAEVALVWPPANLDEFRAHWRRVEGRYQFSGRGSSIAIVWWTDRLGHKHGRIVGAWGVDVFFRDTDLNCEGRDCPFLRFVYPDDLYLRVDGDSHGVWAVCRCGVTGTPDELGWMGPWCTACHDRAAEGNPQTRPGQHRPVVLTGHPFWVGDVVFLSDSRTLLVHVQHDPAVWVWDTLTAQSKQWKFAGQPRNTQTNGLSIDPQGQRAALSGNGRVRTWLLPDGRDGVTLDVAVRDNGRRVALAFSPDGALLASVCERHTTCGWQVTLSDTHTGKTVRSLDTGERHPAHVGTHSLAFSPNGQILAIGWRDPLVRLWNPHTGEELPPLPGPVDDVDVVAFSPDGKTLAVGYNHRGRGELWLWDMPTRALRGNFKDATADIAFSLDGRIMATVGNDSILHLRNAGDGQPVAEYRWHQADLDAVAFSPDGQWIATGGKEERVKLWPVAGLLAEQTSNVK